MAGLDRAVRSRISDVAGLAKRERLPEELTAAREEGAFTQVVDEMGMVIATSENLREEGRALRVVPRLGESVRVTRNVAALDGSFRIEVRSADLANGRVTIYAGESINAVDDAMQGLAQLLAMGIPFLVGLVALTTWRVTCRALRPVEAIRAEVSEIGERDLHRRVPEPASEDEVGKLARTMNEMLGRLDDAGDRQRRFVSDASHELQSPLTSLRARLEVNLAARREPDWRAGEREALVEVVEMQRLVDDLLTLARTDANAGVGRRVPVDLDDLVLREVERLRTSESVGVDVRGVSGGQVLGDPDQLRRAIRNVIDNAKRYANREVAISVQESDAIVEVRIVDDGPGVPVEDAEKVFERFARLDEARARHGSSTGLGLAITRDIVEAHNGSVAAESAGSGGCFVLRFPTIDLAT